MTKKTRKPPSYRQRKGCEQAIVTLTDAVTKQRRDYWLGEYGTPESREFYHQILAEWEANGRRLPAPPQTTDGPLAGMTVAEVLAAYRNWAGGIYRSGDLIKIHAVIRLVRRMFGSTLAVNFGPRALRLVRDQMVCGDPTAEPPRAPWSRPYVNEQVHRIRALFRWAASHEMLPASVYEQLRTVEALKRGRTAARERQAVKPVADEMVDAIKPFVSRQVWALIQLQRFTGALGDELFTLRPVDIDMSDQIPAPPRRTPRPPLVRAQRHPHSRVPSRPDRRQLLENIHPRTLGHRARRPRGNDAVRQVNFRGNFRWQRASPSGRSRRSVGNIRPHRRPWPHRYRMVSQTNRERADAYCSSPQRRCFFGFSRTFCS